MVNGECQQWKEREEKGESCRCPAETFISGEGPRTPSSLTLHACMGLEQQLVGDQVSSLLFSRGICVSSRNVQPFVRLGWSLSVLIPGSPIASQQVFKLLSYYILHPTEVGESSSSTSTAERQLRRSYTYIVEEDVVGVEENVKAIVDLLVKEKTHYRVASIWGMGGLAKTTLSKTIYKHIEIKRYFKCVAWAYISQQCNTREVLEGILIKLLSPSNKERKAIGRLNHDELVKKLHQVQSEKKCLVILDDIWKDADWDSLSPGFPHTTEVGSKILLTTDNENVAKHNIHAKTNLNKTNNTYLGPCGYGIEFKNN
ncbi:hypothetical protein ACSBR1_018869 [Camellia fascicularis]